MSRPRALPGWLTGAAVGVAAAIVWSAADELAWPARAMTVLFIAVLPASLAGQARITAEEARSISTDGLYLTSIVGIWLLAALALAAALGSGFGLGVLGLRPVEPVAALLWTGGVTAFGVLVLALGRWLRHEESPLVARLVPRTSRQRALFILVCLSAGMGEELAFRGFLIPALHSASGSVWLATILSSAAFGMIHSYQHMGGVLRATGLGIALAAPFLATGSLVPSMIAHAMIDLIAGLALADWLLVRDRRPPDEK